MQRVDLPKGYPPPFKSLAAEKRQVASLINEGKFMSYNDVNATVPVSKVRNLIRGIVMDGGFLKSNNGAWQFNTNSPFTGLNTGTTYKTEDEALDALLGIYFPEIRGTKAA